VTSDMQRHGKTLTYLQSVGSYGVLPLVSFSVVIKFSFQQSWAKLCQLLVNIQRVKLLNVRLLTSKFVNGLIDFWYIDFCYLKFVLIRGYRGPQRRPCFRHYFAVYMTRVQRNSVIHVLHVVLLNRRC